MKKLIILLFLAIAALSGCTIKPLALTSAKDLSASAPEQNVLAAANSDLLIRNAILLSPERAEPLYNMDLLIQDGYIVTIQAWPP